MIALVILENLLEIIEKKPNIKATEKMHLQHVLDLLRNTSSLSYKGLRK
jgi:hypothetical protein